MKGKNESIKAENKRKTEMKKKIVYYQHQTESTQIEDTVMNIKYS